MCLCSLSYPPCKARAPCYIVVCDLSGFTLYIFSWLSHKRHYFQGKKLLSTKRVLSFFKLLSETFLILRRIWPAITVHRSSCKVPVMFIIFYETWPSSTEFGKILKYQISWKSVQWEPNFCMRTHRRTDGRTDRRDEARLQNVLLFVIICNNFDPS
jgi:hypothetical protein